MQTTKIITLSLCLLAQSVQSSHAMLAPKAKDEVNTVQQAHFRNAFTDASLRQVKPGQKEESEPLYLDFRGGNYNDANKPQVHAHGKHLAGIVFLSLAGAFLLLGLLSLASGRSSHDSSGNNFLAALCAFPVIGFVIPGAILLHRYPNGKSPHEE